MSAPIGPGDWVECVDGHPHVKGGGVSLVRGKLYQVGRAFPAGCLIAPGWRAFEPSIRVVGDPLPFPLCWRLSRFRPIYRPDASIIQALKQPSPEIVREVEQERAPAKETPEHASAERLGEAAQMLRPGPG